MHYRRRPMMVLAALALVAAASVTVFQSASARSGTVWTKWGHFKTSASGQPQPEPAHWSHSHGPHLSGTIETDESTNWSGYVETGPQFTGVSAQWVVPTVQPSETSEFSATWIGIDGATNSELIQTGTSQDTSDGSTTYFAWYEILPAASITIGSVSPGDQMEASIVEDSTGTWTIAISDLTSGQSASGEVPYDGPGASAEWIEEAPSVNGQQSTLADFGTAQFSNLGVNGLDLTSGVLTPVDMINGSSNVIAYPGAIANESFTIVYGTPPVSAPTTTTTSTTTTPTTTTPTTTSTTTHRRQHRRQHRRRLQQVHRRRWFGLQRPSITATGWSDPTGGYSVSDRRSSMGRRGR